MTTIRETIDYYKNNIDKYWENEKYKWEALKHFQDNWDIDSEEFSSMLEESLRKASTLLSGAMYYPYKMICKFAVINPEKTRGLFRLLFNEDLPLVERLQPFRDGCDEMLNEFTTTLGSEKAKNHYQDLRALCVYLSFRYPKKYYLFKSRMYKGFKDKIGYIETSQEADSEIRKYSNFSNLCQQIVDGVKDDPDLIRMQQERENASTDYFNDSDFHLLAQTIMYIGSGEYGDWDAEKKTEPTNATKEMSLDNIETRYKKEKEKMNSSGIGLNTILYGPPGTGKTYHTAYYAVAICDNIPIEEVIKWDIDSVLARYEVLKEQEKRIAFTTFHQSYGYEEFIEGIRPVMGDESTEDSYSNSRELYYEVKSGVFKKFCDMARNSYVCETNVDWGLNDNPTVWKVSLEGAGDNATRTECLENGHIRIGWDEYGEDINRETVYQYGGKVILNAFYNKMKKGDIVISCYSSELTDAIGVITGDAEWDPSFDYYERVRKVNWLVKGIRENIVKINENKPMVLASVYKMDVSSEDALNIVKKYLDSPEKSTDKKNYVFIIDEINRGNISKVFGELITLIESSKREGAKEKAEVTLPYSNKPFAVPDNVYILGTMNTADRSIALMDTALRRRFQFIEMMPNLDVIKDLTISESDISLNVSDMLGIINKRIEFLYDREHTIGHAFFISLLDKEMPKVSDLGLIFKKSIIPLLQEYFYEDYEKIRLVLGDNAKKDKSIEFIVAEPPEKDLFRGNVTDEDYKDYIYKINEDAFSDIRSYKGISEKL